MMRIGLQLTQNPEKYSQLLHIIQEQLDPAHPVEFVHITDEVSLRSEIAALDILVCYRLSPESFSFASSRLKWIHFGAAGIEHSLFPELLNSQIVLTNARGIHAEPVSEFILAAMLYFSKRFPDCQQFKLDQQWRQWDIARQMVQLNGKKLGIIGFGAIGKSLAKKAKSFSMEVIAVKRTQRIPETARNCDHLLPPLDLPLLLKNADYVAITCPLTPHTRGMLGWDELEIMKTNAILVNISRGAILDESALIQTLRENRIAGAALDVFTEEPLAENHPLFQLDNVLLSPHISGNFPEYQTDVCLQFAQYLGRYLSGKKPGNIIGKQRLY